MSTPTFSPPHTGPEDASTHLSERGYAVLAPTGVSALIGGADPSSLHAYWEDLPRDEHLLDGGAYRFRRHGSFVVEGGELREVPHRPHWQPVDYNALHGGIERWFEPLDSQMARAPEWRALLLGLTEQAAQLADYAEPWFIEAHVLRISAEGGIGRPTPEGAHRDGVDMVAVTLMERVGIKGGETRIFDAAGPSGQRFTMVEPGTTVLLDDARTIHETTPIQPLGDAPGPAAHRDTLVLTWRRDGFQAPVNE